MCSRSSRQRPKAKATPLIANIANQLLEFRLGLRITGSVRVDVSGHERRVEGCSISRRALGNVLGEALNIMDDPSAGKPKWQQLRLLPASYGRRKLKRFAWRPRSNIFSRNRGGILSILGVLFLLSSAPLRNRLGSRDLGFQCLLPDRVADELAICVFALLPNFCSGDSQLAPSSFLLVEPASTERVQAPQAIRFRRVVVHPSACTRIHALLA